jgi:kinesin family protein C2/C3
MAGIYDDACDLESDGEGSGSFEDDEEFTTMSAKAFSYKSLTAKAALDDDGSHSEEEPDAERSPSHSIDDPDEKRSPSHSVFDLPPIHSPDLPPFHSPAPQKRPMLRLDGTWTTPSHGSNPPAPPVNAMAGPPMAMSGPPMAMSGPPKALLASMFNTKPKVEVGVPAKKEAEDDDGDEYDDDFEEYDSSDEIKEEDEWINREEVDREITLAVQKVQAAAERSIALAKEEAQKQMQLQMATMQEANDGAEVNAELLEEVKAEMRQEAEKEKERELEKLRKQAEQEKHRELLKLQAKTAADRARAIKAARAELEGERTRLLEQTKAQILEAREQALAQHREEAAASKEEAVNGIVEQAAKERAKDLETRLKEVEEEKAAALEEARREAEQQKEVEINNCILEAAAAARTVLEQSMADAEEEKQQWLRDYKAQVEVEKAAAIDAVRKELELEARARAEVMAKEQQEALGKAVDEAIAQASGCAARDKDEAVMAAVENAVQQAVQIAKAKVEEEEAKVTVAEEEARKARLACEEVQAQATAEAAARKQAEASVMETAVELSALKAQAAEMQETHGTMLTQAVEACTKRVMDEASAHVAAAKKEAEEYKQLYVSETVKRKAIHNQLLDMQGNIRVYCRVRPILEVDRMVKGKKRAEGSDNMAVEYPADGAIIVRKDHTVNPFDFDQVFNSSSTQVGVYQQVSPFVTSALDGYNVCIFAYGQTGCGKTHTMEGNMDDRGVNMRALLQLFAETEARADNADYELCISVLEIYNETVRDLLTNSAKAIAGAETKGKENKLEIRKGKDGKTFVQGLTEIKVSEMPEVEALMAEGQAGRQVGGHDMNAHSSRSHLILSVSIKSTNKFTGEKLSSKLQLIDLAGSERVGKTDATGDRLKEAQAINKSLSALGNVIQARANNKGHVPYRDSKLTYLLQDSLEGNSKVLMFVNVSPVAYNASETLCSLNFASRCRATVLGKAKKNASKGDKEAKSSSSSRSSSASSKAAAKERPGLKRSSTR